MNVLSCFDGIEGARLALDKANINVDSFYASEIDKYASAIARYNYPDTIHLGSIIDWPVWDMIHSLPKFDLIIGGFPCQSYSTAGKQLGLEDIRGQLLYYLLGAIKYFKPKYFVLENVKGILSPKFKPVIDLIYRELDNSGYKVNHKLLNSALTSAQTRKRVYFTNFEISEPKDDGLLLKDILEDNPDSKLHQISEKTIDRINRRNYSKPKVMPGKTGTINTKNNSGNLSIYSGTTLIPFTDRDKSLTLTSSYRFNPSVKEYTVQKRKQLVGMIKQDGELKEKNDKSQCIDANYFKGIDNHGQRTVIAIIQKQRWFNKGGVKAKDGKVPTLSSNSWQENNHLCTNGIKWRKLTPIECERLQTVPDNYTEFGTFDNGETKKISNTQRYKALGNGFEIGMVSHILSYIKDK